MPGDVRVTAGAARKAGNHVAYFKGRAAELATMEVTTRWYRATMLKLAPGWIEFAIESDKNSYDKIVKEIEELDRQIDEDLAEAVSVSQEIEDVRARAAVLMAKARVDFSRYLLLKGKCVQTPFRSHLWKYEFMHHPFWETLLVLPSGDARKLSSLLRTVRSSLSEAASLFDAVSDSNAASAYLNLANDLRTAHHFRAARKYLTMARSRAQKYGDQAVLRRADLLEKSIKAKNRDTPHYEKGEGRDLDAM